MSDLCLMVGQVQRLLGTLTRYGSSTRLALSSGNLSLAIRSIGRRFHLQRTLCGFLRYAYGRGVTKLKALRTRHGMQWAMSAASPNTRRTRLLDLKWFERALREKMGLHLRLVAKNVRIEQSITRTKQWSPTEKQHLLDHLRQRNGAVADAIEYGAALGLRPCEIMNATVGHYDATAGLLHVPGLKFGHARDVKVPEQLRSGLEKLTEGRNHKERLYPNVTQRLMRETLADCRRALGVDDDRRSLTAFRKTFAQAEYDWARAAGMSDGDARRHVARQLGHGNVNRARIDVARGHYLQTRSVKLVRKGSTR